MKDEPLTIDEVTSLCYNDIKQLVRYKVSDDEDAKDITQKVFLALHLSWDTLKAKNTDTLWKWLYRTAKNKINDYYRKNYSEKESHTYIPDFQNSINISITDEEISEMEINQHISYVMKKLTDEENQLYKERYIKKIEYSELASKYGISENAVRMKVSRINHKIRMMIKLLLYIYAI